MLFSATMPGDVVNLARRYMDQPTHIRAVDPDEDGSQLVRRVEQHVYRAHPLDKPEVLSRILQSKGRGHTLIFCRTKRHAQRLSDDLGERGFAVGAVHGDLGQGAREQAMRAFRNGKVDVLVATDVAARGIDVEGITHVVNYSCPEDEKTYVHRIGRTARAGASGVGVTFVDWDDLPRWSLINKALGLSFDQPQETYSTSDHLFTDLGISPDVTGVLPKTERTRAGLSAEELEDIGETGRKPRSTERDANRPKSSRDRGRTSGDRSSGNGKPREKPAAPRRDRERNRTRGGQSVRTDAQAAPASGEAPPARRRRRRGRGGSGSGTAVPTSE
jgi:superfamily II DNA/RNA helicase